MGRPRKVESIMENKTLEKIKLAFVHQALVIPGHIGSEVTISKDKIPLLDYMAQDDHKLYLYFKDGLIATTPLTNVIVSIFDHG